MIRRSWTRAASVEETLAVRAASLREIKKRIRPLFRQERVATNAGLFLEGLLGDEQRKTGWMRAEAAGEDSFETAKNEFGLDHNESRSWHGWHRHVSLVM